MAQRSLQDHRFHSVQPELEDLARRRNLQPEALVLRREVSAPLLVRSQVALEPRRKCRAPNRDNGDQPRCQTWLARLLTITKASPPWVSTRQALRNNRAGMETCRLKF